MATLMAKSIAISVLIFRRSTQIFFTAGAFFMICICLGIALAIIQGDRSYAVYGLSASLVFGAPLVVMLAAVSAPLILSLLLFEIIAMREALDMMRKQIEEHPVLWPLPVFVTILGAFILAILFWSSAVEKAFGED